MGQAGRKGKEAWGNCRKTRMETICFEWTPRSTIRKVKGSHNSCGPDADGQSDTNAVWEKDRLSPCRGAGGLPESQEEQQMVLSLGCREKGRERKVCTAGKPRSFRGGVF